MPSETRTGPLVKRLVEGLQADLNDGAAQISVTSASLEALEVEVRGVNGLSSLCKAWRQQLDKMRDDMLGEVEAVEKKMLGETGKKKITEYVNPDHADAAVTAKGRGA